MEKLLLIDMRGPMIVKVSCDYEALRYWGELLCEPGQVRIQPLAGRYFSTFSMAELGWLCLNAQGRSGKYTEYADMLREAVAAASALPVDETPVSELVERLGRTLEPPKSIAAREFAEEPAASPQVQTPTQKRRSFKAAVQAIAGEPGGSPAPAKPKPAAEPKAPRPKRDPADTTGRPAAGSKTGQVWEIADKLWKAAKSDAALKDSKEFKKKVVDACVAAGINGSTAGVQFAKWARG